MKKFLIASLIGAATIAGAANFPLSWIGEAVLPDSITPRPVFLGTIWNGQIANIDGINPVGTSVDLRKILSGSAPLSFKSRSPFLTFSGNAKLNGAVTTQAKGHITGLRVFDARFQSMAGTYDLSLEDMVIRESCASGNGTFSTDILEENYAQWQWKGPIVSGPITCENGQIIAKLSGQDQTQNITAQINIDLNGQYRAHAKVVTSDPRAAFVLPLFGFEKTSQGFSLAEAGAWR